MAVDLTALRGRCQEEAGDEWERYYLALVGKYADRDLCCYGLYVHGKHPTLRALAESRHMRLWAELLEQWPQLLLVCPPEHGKTTVMRWHIEQWIGRQTEMVYGSKLSGTPSSGALPAERSSILPITTANQQLSVERLAPSALLVMNTAKQAEKQCMAIAATLESNRRYRELYPHVKPAPKWGWTKDTLYCERPSDGTAQPDPTLQATGVFGPIQGARVGLCVVDDPTDQQDARSETVLDNQKEWHQGVLSDRIIDGGLKRDICTRWARTDIAQMLMESETWHSAVLPALGQLSADQQMPIWPEAYPDYPWGRELWPEKWSAERLEKTRKEKLLVEGALLWQLAYLCNPTDTGGNLFRQQWFQYADIPYEFEGAIAA